MKKGCLVTLASLTVFAAIVLFVALKMTGPVVEAADQFFADIGAGRIQEAYNRTSDDFRSQTSEQEFANWAAGHGLDRFESTSWSSRNMENNDGRVEGTVTLKSGEELPVIAVLVHQNEAWRIHGVEFQAAGTPTTQQTTSTPEVTTETKTPPSPGNVTLEDARVLALGTLLAFNHAVVTQEFESFHQDLAAPFQGQYSPEQLQEAFQPFFDQGIDIAPIIDVEPTFNRPPAVNSNGYLELSGTFPTQPSQVKFDLQYLEEDGEWRLIDINVNVE